MNKIYILFAIFLSLVLHKAFGSSFPSPWGDEIHLLIPALSFSEDYSFSAYKMLNLNGIYWMPSMIYIVNGTIFKILGFGNILAARYISYAEIVISAGILLLILKNLKNEHKYYFVSMLWLFSVPIVLAANTARPEALSIFFSFLVNLLFLLTFSKIIKNLRES
jgi:hypothetical protein